MPICTKKHFNKKGDSLPKSVRCYYIAGVCIVDPIHEGGLTRFLKGRYPYYHSPFYDQSKIRHETIVPNDISAAEFNTKGSGSS
jgi:hypothetical protein